MSQFKSKRKSYRKSKSHRKSKSQRKSHRKSQRGGGNCAMMPLNRSSFAQSGGMAAISQGDAYLLDAATRVQAQVGPLDISFGELPSVIPKMSGGGRKKSRGSRKTKSKRSRKSKSQRKSQRGGDLAAFDMDTLLLKPAQYAMDGTNPQFRTEGSVNPQYRFN